MDKFVAVVLLAIVAIALITGVGFLLAFPTMWLVNYLFAASFLQFMFGISSLTVMKAWALNVVAGLLFKTTSSSK